MGELLRATAAIGADSPDLAAVVRGPGDIGDPLAVGRPGGHEFALVAAGEAMWSASGNVHHVEMSKGGENEARAGGRLHGLLDEAEFHGAFVHAHGQVEVRAKSAGDLCGEGNFGVCAVVDGDAVNFSAIGDDDFLAVGRKGVVREEVAGEEGFLIVALDRVFQPVFFTAVQIADAQTCFRLDRKSVV